MVCEKVRLLVGLKSSCGKISKASAVKTVSV